MAHVSGLTVDQVYAIAKSFAKEYHLEAQWDRYQFLAAQKLHYETMTDEEIKALDNEGIETLINLIPKVGTSEVGSPSYTLVKGLHRGATIYQVYRGPDGLVWVRFSGL